MPLSPSIEPLHHLKGPKAMTADHDLDVERRLSAVETKIDTLATRDAEILKALKELQQSHISLSGKIDRYQVGAKAVIGFGTIVGSAAWFIWSSIGHLLVKRG